MLTELLAAASADTPFPLAFKRAMHFRHGHPIDKSDLIESKQFERHPQNNSHFVFTVNLYRCNDCGLHWIDDGFQGRST